VTLRALRFLTAGESHGPQLTVIVEGLPAGMPLLADQIDAQLARRQRGHGRGGRMKIERDQVRIVGGVRHGRTLGSPIALVVENRDWVNWQHRMGVEPPPEPVARVTRLRPGHADLPGAIKYGHDDVRNVLERASARETAARVAAAAVARVFLGHFGVEIRSHTVAVGEVVARDNERVRVARSGSRDLEVAAFWERVEESPVRCGDDEAEPRMIAAIDEAKAAGDTLGGVWEVVAYGVPMGLGSFAQWDDRLDARLAAAIMSIPSCKGVEIGPGFEVARRRGSRVHDPIVYDRTEGWHHTSNNAGGIEGGVSNGEPIVVRGAMKPISTLLKPLPSTNLETKEPDPAHIERSDVCVVPAAGVVGEAMVALVLADAFRQKFGGDSLSEVERNYRAFVATYRPDGA